MGYWLDIRKNEKLNESIIRNSIQSQLITSKLKPTIYDKNNNNKYEYIFKKKKKRKEMKEYLNSDKIKKILVMHNLNIKIEIEILIMKNLINIAPNNIVIKTSKLENKVNKYNGDHYHYNHKKLDQLNNEELIQLFEFLLF